jgi:ornithine cyclodeaminase
MIHYVGVATLKSLLHNIGIENFILKLVQYLEDDFAAWHSFEKSARVAAHSSSGVIELMPISNAEFYGFKYVNGHPANTQKGLPTVMAFGALAAVETGLPVLLSEMTILTALRTAATSAMTAKLLTIPKNKTHALIGCGAQSEFQALAMKAVLGLTDLRVFDIDNAATQKLLSNLQNHGFTLTACTSVEQCIEGASVITTATAAKTRAKILTKDMVKAGTHINGIGGDCPDKTELEKELLDKCTLIAVEFEPQSRIEGETQQNTNLPVVELAHLLKHPHNHKDTDITLFDSVGFALEDFSALRLIYDLVKNDQNYKLDLIATPQNPKDLFSMINLLVS